MHDAGRNLVVPAAQRLIGFSLIKRPKRSESITPAALHSL